MSQSQPVLCEDTCLFVLSNTNQKREFPKEFPSRRCKTTFESILSPNFATLPKNPSIAAVQEMINLLQNGKYSVSEKQQFFYQQTKLLAPHFVNFATSLINHIYLYYFVFPHFNMDEIPPEMFQAIMESSHDYKFNKAMILAAYCIGRTEPVDSKVVSLVTLVKPDSRQFQKCMLFMSYLKIKALQPTTTTATTTTTTALGENNSNSGEIATLELRVRKILSMLPSPDAELTHCCGVLFNPKVPTSAKQVVLSSKLHRTLTFPGYSHWEPSELHKVPQYPDYLPFISPAQLQTSKLVVNIQLHETLRRLYSAYGGSFKYYIKNHQYCVAVMCFIVFHRLYIGRVSRYYHSGILVSRQLAAKKHELFPSGSTGKWYSMRSTEVANNMIELLPKLLPSVGDKLTTMYKCLFEACEYIYEKEKFEWLHYLVIDLCFPPNRYSVVYLLRDLPELTFKLLSMLKKHFGLNQGTLRKNLVGQLNKMSCDICIILE